MKTSPFILGLRLRLGRLQSPRTRDSARQSAAATVGVGLILFLVAQLTLGVAGEESLLLKDPGYADKERLLAKLEAANPCAPRVVMLGTSRTGYAFHGERIEQQLVEDLGRPAVTFNFGIPASGPIGHLIYAHRLFARGHKPDLLLLEVLPPGLADLPEGPLESRFLFGNRLQHHEAEKVIGYGFPASATRRQWRESVIEPWFSLRFPLMGRVAPSALPWHLRFDWSRTTDPHGWSTPMVEMVTDKEYAERLESAKAEYRGTLQEFHPTGGAARALGDLLALCRDQGVPVKLVLMPESEGFRSIYSPQATSRLYTFLTRLCAQHGCELIDTREWLSDSAFSDGHHQLRSGAEAFSDRLYRDVIRPFFQSN